jgi:uncharacterized protein YqjF (DUF2071 family)
VREYQQCRRSNPTRFLHWLYDPRLLQRLLLGGLRPHTFEGRAWVGLTPFFLEDLRTPVAPALPWFTSFPEANVRTYVQGRDGREGLWFFSLDAARLEPVLVARSTGSGVVQGFGSTSVGCTRLR